VKHDSYNNPLPPEYVFSIHVLYEGNRIELFTSLISEVLNGEQYKISIYIKIGGYKF